METTKTKAIVVERTQKSVGSTNTKFGGPDVYVVVLLVPEGAIVPKVLNEKVLKMRNIVMKYIGEGYSKHTGPSSALGKARSEAIRFAEEHNKESGF